jgi:hypothetical protein
MQRQMNLRLPNKTVFRPLKTIAAVDATDSRFGIGIEQHHTGRVDRKGQSICLSHRGHVSVAGPTRIPRVCETSSIPVDSSQYR